MQPLAPASEPSGGSLTLPVHSTRCPPRPLSRTATHACRTRVPHANAHECARTRTCPTFNPNRRYLVTPLASVPLALLAALALLLWRPSALGPLAPRLTALGARLLGSAGRLGPLFATGGGFSLFPHLTPLALRILARNF